MAFDIEKYEWSQPEIIEANIISSKAVNVELEQHTGYCQINRNDAIALAKHFGEHKSQIQSVYVVQGVFHCSRTTQTMGVFLCREQAEELLKGCYKDMSTPANGCEFHIEELPIGTELTNEQN